MELVGHHVGYPQACQDLEVNPEPHGTAPGGPVGSGAGNVGLENDNLAGLGTLEGVYRVVQLDFGFLHPDIGLVPGAAGKENHVLAPDRAVEHHFHFPVRETVGIKDFYAVDFFRHLYKTGKFYQVIGNPGRVVLHGTGGGNDKFIHTFSPGMVFSRVPLSVNL
jgi:hypothetical protein